MENVNRKERNRALEAVIDLPWGAGTKEIIAGGGVQVHLSIFPTPLKHKFLVFLPLFSSLNLIQKSFKHLHNKHLCYLVPWMFSNCIKLTILLWAPWPKLSFSSPTIYFAEMSYQESYGSWFTKLSSQTQMHCCS